MAQEITLTTLVIGGAAWALWQLRRFRRRGDASSELTLPPLVLVSFAAVAFLIEGLFLQISGLIVVGFLALLVVVLLTLWPYEHIICRIAQSAIGLDRFLRSAYFGFPVILVLLSALAVCVERGGDATDLDGRLSAWDVGGLLAVAFLFHTFAYVFNDVFDLEVDRHQERRRQHPLVRGSVLPSTALAGALVTIPGALLVNVLLHSARNTLGWTAVASSALLIGAFALMAIYNWPAPRGVRPQATLGKRFPYPPVTDFVQAVGWGALAPYAALVVDPYLASDNWIVVWTIAAFGTGYILLINGIHGGLRDLENDAAQGCNTTAIFLGAKADADGAALSTRAVRVFAYSVHTGMFCVMPIILLATARDPGDTAPVWAIELTTLERWVIGLSVGVFFAVSHLVLRAIVSRKREDRERLIGLHLLFMMTTPLVAFAPVVGFTGLWVACVFFFAPLLTNERILCHLLERMHPGITPRIQAPPQSRTDAAGGAPPHGADPVIGSPR